MSNRFLHSGWNFKKAKKTGEEKWKTSFIAPVLPQEGAELRARMPILPVTIFRKSVACPSSETLLAYRQLHLRRIRRDWVEAHLAYCDFCPAELQLLDRYRGINETATPGEVPEELRKLAESVLANLAGIYSHEGWTSN